MPDPADALFRFLACPVLDDILRLDGRPARPGPAGPWVSFDALTAWYGLDPEPLWPELAARWPESARVTAAGREVETASAFLWLAMVPPDAFPADWRPGHAVFCGYMGEAMVAWMQRECRLARATAETATDAGAP